MTIWSRHSASEVERSEPTDAAMPEAGAATILGRGSAMMTSSMMGDGGTDVRSGNDAITDSSSLSPGKVAFVAASFGDLTKDGIGSAFPSGPVVYVKGAVLPPESDADAEWLVFGSTLLLLPLERLPGTMEAEPTSNAVLGLFTGVLGGENRDLRARFLL